MHFMFRRLIGFGHVVILSSTTSTYSFKCSKGIAKPKLLGCWPTYTSRMKRDWKCQPENPLDGAGAEYKRGSYMISCAGARPCAAEGLKIWVILSCSCPESAATRFQTSR